MPRTYTITGENVTVAAASGDVDLFGILAASNTALELVEFVLGQSSELGDAAEEQLRLKLIRGHTTAGSGGATPTPRPVSPLDSAALFTAHSYNPTIASAGTAVDLWSDDYNVRAGYPWGPKPQGMGHWTNGTAWLVLRLMAAVADDITGVSFTASVIEYP